MVAFLRSSERPPFLQGVVKVLHTLKAIFDFPSFRAVRPKLNQILTLSPPILQIDHIFILLPKNILLCRFPKMAYAIYFLDFLFLKMSLTNQEESMHYFFVHFRLIKKKRKNLSQC